FGIKNEWIEVNPNTNRLYTKTYANAKLERKKKSQEYFIHYQKRTKPYSSLEFTNNKYSNDRAKKNLEVFNLSKKFDYSKPVELIKALIQSHKNKNAVVLDFFAGSGTTAQSVVELNALDNGERSFILCTNNENEICTEITYPRIKKTITGYSFVGKKEEVLYEKKLTQRDLKNMDKTWNSIEEIKKQNISKYNRIRSSLKDGIYTLFG